MSCTKEETSRPSTVKDIDGNEYNTILIGDQLWMKENLRTSRFSNGDFIPTTSPRNKPVFLKIHPIYQWTYFETITNPTIYGKFYTWFVMQDNRNVCPDGWHVPTNKEWNKLIEYLGGSNIAGGKLKETTSDYWPEANAGATNSSGFSGVPTSMRLDSELSLFDHNKASFWTSVESDFIMDGAKGFAKCFKIEGESTKAIEKGIIKTAGLTCRCIQND